MQFEEFLKCVITKNKLLTATLSSPKKKSEKKTIVRAGIRQLAGAKKTFQISLEDGKQVRHLNLDEFELQEFVKHEMKEGFKQGIFKTAEEVYHLLSNKKSEVIVTKKKNTGPQTTLQFHNRIKNHILEEGVPISFLIHLGVMQMNGKVTASKYAKFRQINRFLELIDDLLSGLAVDSVLKVIDFGCGKAYLTFALYHYLHNMKGLKVDILGLDLKEDVIAFCQKTAKELKFDGLRFEKGDIAGHTEAGNVDLVVALHACNTATDAAIAKAITWKARLIAVAPCCQHELFNQVKAEQLQPLLKHGILKERFAALATDAARAALLEQAGYKTDIVEFIDSEHTPKNLMIRARLVRERKHLPDPSYSEYKEFLSIRPSLESMLNS